jgi:hypothetical protein
MALNRRRLTAKVEADAGVGDNDVNWTPRLNVMFSIEIWSIPSDMLLQKPKMETMELVRGDGVFFQRLLPLSK